MLSILNRLKRSKTIIFGVIALLLAYNYYENQQGSSLLLSPIVTISTGKIQGIISKSRDGKEFYEYLGIPYAKPPIGELRFEVPQPSVFWDGVKDASINGPDCIQINPIFQNTISGAEDCLFLNVFSPKIGSNGFSKNLLPVMVFIHGGYFMSGGANYHRPNYFMDEYIILVTINYRLGSLGFLNTGDGIVRGNMGLKDQTMALKWIQQNIVQFGGDPSRVTLFGESAGSRSVHFHMMSQMSKGLFHKAISQSGTAFKTWATEIDTKSQTKWLTERLNCNKTTSEESVRCLKELKAETIIEIHKESTTPIPNKLYLYGPSIETFEKDVKDTFISEDPKSIITSGRGNNVPWMVGVNSAEGLLFTARIMNKEEYKNQFETKKFETILPQIFVYNQNNQDITTKIRKFYFDVDNNDQKIDFMINILNYTNLFSDRYYNYGTRTSALLQSKFSPVYIYYNDYLPEFTFFDLLTINDKFPVIIEIIWKLTTNWFQKNILRMKPLRYGVCHGDELSLMFPFPMGGVTHNSNDFVMSRSLVKLWVQFAYDDSKMIFNDIPWTPVISSKSDLKYMQFSNDPNSNKLIDEPFNERIKFWDSLNLQN